MLTLLGTAFSGWIALIAFASTALLALALRRLRFARAGGLRPMRLHYGLGFAVPAIAFIHAWIPMSMGRAGGFERIGLWIATIALLLLFVQMMLGMSLRGTGGRGLRPLHLVLMIALTALITTHIALDMA